MITIKKIGQAVGLTALLTMSVPTLAADYVIDTKGAHASINFKISHLGFSWLHGRFDTFNGEFSFDDANPEAGTVSVEIDTASVNSNHAERDKHLRSADFLNVSEHPTAKFESTGIKVLGDRKAIITGNLTLRGVTKVVEIEADYVGGGKDPWGNYRQGFVGTTELALADFGIPFDLGPASRSVEMTLNVEGIRQ